MCTACNQPPRPKRWEIPPSPCRHGREAGAAPTPIVVDKRGLSFGSLEVEPQALASFALSFFRSADAPTGFDGRALSPADGQGGHASPAAVGPLLSLPAEEEAPRVSKAALIRRARGAP